MKPTFLGDSYDIVKQSLLRGLGAMGTWATHPMFSERVSPNQAQALSHLLGTRLLSEEALTPASDRAAYLAPARECRHHVFLDPDTGIRLEPIQGGKAPLYVFGTEILAIVSARPYALTLVFDQSLARGREREQLGSKLAVLADHGLHAVAYVSHACFVLVGASGPLVARAAEALAWESRLPESRFLTARPRHSQISWTAAAPTQHAR